MPSLGSRSIARVAALTCAAIFAPLAAGPARPLAAATFYDNTGNPANMYYSAQGGAEAIDDLHLVSGGTLDSLTFEYYDPAPSGTLSATVNVYANPGGLDLEAAPLAGPFTSAGLPRGRRSVTIPLNPRPVVTAHLWVGVRFTSATAGLILNSVPAAGSSHDLYLENAGFYWFGGDPKANFGLRLFGTSPPVAAVSDPAPQGVTLAAAQPNPFREGTTLRYTIDRPGHVLLEVCDVSGRRVRALVNGIRHAGQHSEQWTGRDDIGHTARAGVYFVRLVTAAGVRSRRVVLTQ